MSEFDIGEGKRGSGRTHAMMMSAPDTGAIFVTHHGAMRRYLINMILQHRGKAFLDRCDVWVVEEVDDVTRTRGLKPRPIFIDHAWWESRIRAAAVHALLEACDRWNDR